VGPRRGALLEPSAPRKAAAQAGQKPVGCGSVWGDDEGARGERTMTEIDKPALLALFKERLEHELHRAQKRAKDAADGATHEENRAEGDKDMRATEASYVARGISGRVAEMEEALLRVAAMTLLTFDAGARIALSALVELEQDEKRQLYFLVAAAGGERLELGGAEVQTLTTQSPLGRALLGLTEGEQAELPARKGEAPRVYDIVRVR
jgi:transcription elongation GreA/GreB family factor